MTSTARAQVIGPEAAPGGAEVLAAMADLLSYPGARSEAAAALLAAAGVLGDGPVAETFRGPTTAVEELYTRTFDLDPTCPPYVGHHLFGEETGRRGPFLARLLEIYARDGFRPREELADHVAEVLRFLAVARPGAERDDLVRDGLLPALRAMAEHLDGESNPYREVLGAARHVVETTCGGPDARGGP